MASVRGTLAIAALALIVGCGDGLKDTTYEGAPLFTIEGTLIENSVGYTVAGGNLRYAMFWNVGVSLTLAEAEFVEDLSTGRPYAPPARFVMQLYRPPHILGPRGYSIGSVMIYDDADGDGRKDPGEQFHGGATATLVAYAPEPIPADIGVLGSDVPQGFSVIASPLGCLGEFPISEDRCAIPVGAGCLQDADCAAPAVCAESVVATRLPGGMCVLLTQPPDEVDGPCGTDARYLPVYGGSWLRLIEPVDGVWLPACERDADCTRRGYHCATGVGVCLPNPAFEVIADAPGALPPLCVQDFGEPRPALSGGE